jgi:hypothetical protein
MKVGSVALGLAAISVLAFGAATRQKSPSPAAVVAKPTYAEHVAPILNSHCVACHRPGQVAPFSLIGYENAKKWSGMMSRVTHEGLMPPWKAEAGYGEFLDENRLSESELQILKAWQETGSSRGDAKKEPPTPKFETEWALGEPDIILQPEKPFKLGPEGQDLYRNFVMKTTSDKPMWVRAMDVRPGNAKVVHHVIVFLDKQGASKALESKESDGQEGYTSEGGGVGFLPSGSLGGWAPGLTPKMAQPGVAFKVDPGTTVVLQVHYHRTGKEETDQTKVGLYLSKEPATKELNLAWIFNFAIRIPANDSEYQAKREYVWPANATLYGVMPHMHLIGRSMKSWLEFPDGTVKPLINVPSWDFNWQLFYTFKEPIHVQAGTKQIVEAVYDNSTGNINNPNSPPKLVKFGESTSDEMFLMIVPYTLDK